MVGVFVVACRAGLIALALYGWFWSQSLIGVRPLPPLPKNLDDAGVRRCFFIGDALHEALTPVTEFLRANPAHADMLLIVSSLCIDCFSIFFIFYSLFGPSVRPILGILITFFMRQSVQFICQLSAPNDMIWRDPGFPSLLVTYSVGSDFFFSGHTAIAVTCAIELMRIGNNMQRSCGSGYFLLDALALSFVALEVSTVLVLRAHWTLDVFTGALAGRYATIVASWFAPLIDNVLASGKQQHVKSQ